MGSFITVPTESIQRSQDYLKPETIRFILGCLKAGKLGDLPPTPIVKLVAPDRFVAIDGHNLIAVRHHRHEPIEVYVADTASDALPNPDHDKATDDRNTDLAQKFDHVKELGIFDELVEQNRPLFD